MSIDYLFFSQPQLLFVPYACVHYRVCIVDFLHSVCENLQLTRSTRFLAMHLVDHFMDRHIVMDYRLKLVALTCLLVAGKQQRLLPFLQQCNKF